MSTLPIEIWRMIIEYSLDFNSYKLLRAISRAVCREFQSIIQAIGIPTKLYDFKCKGGYHTTSNILYGFSFQLLLKGAWISDFIQSWKNILRS